MNERRKMITLALGGESIFRGIGSLPERVPVAIRADLSSDFSAGSCASSRTLRRCTIPIHRFASISVAKNTSHTGSRSSRFLRCP